MIWVFLLTFACVLGSIVVVANVVRPDGEGGN